MDIKVIRNFDREDCPLCELGLEVHCHARWGQSVWIVPSLSTLGQLYQVELASPREGQCNCRWGASGNTRGFCSHLRIAQSLCHPQHPQAREIAGIACMVQLLLALDAVAERVGHYNYFYFDARQGLRAELKKILATRPGPEPPGPRQAVRLLPAQLHPRKAEEAAA